MLLQGKVALITGAASERGIGRATAEIFAQQGAKVIIVDLDLAQSQHAAKALGEGHLGLAANVANEEQAHAAVEQALQHYGKIDILVNNAGITQPVKTLDIKRNDYDRILDVSLRGTLIMSQAVIPSMKENGGGSIVCLSSVSAQRGGGIFGGPHYSAAKAGLIGATKALALELAKRKITVNCVAPGLIETEMVTEEVKAHALKMIPMQRMGQVDEVASVVKFLCSDDAAYITRQVISVNGGLI